MLLLFVIILLVVGLAIIGAMYSLFSPFFQQLGDIKQYNMAYYGAVSSLERGMSALRYHGPGFEGESGWKQYDNDFTAAPGDIVSQEDFGLLADGDMYRDIASRATQIPSSGAGDVPYALRGEGSENYLTLSPNQLMEYQLSLDETSDASEFYTATPGSAEKVNPGSVELYARLPEGLSGLGDLPYECSQPGCDVDQDGDNINDDLVVDWSIEGEYGDEDDFFRIVPRVDVNYVSGTVNRFDTLIRESHINATTDSKVTAAWGGAYTKNPTNISNPFQPTAQNMVGPSDVVDAIGAKSFESIFGVADTISLVLGLARELQTASGRYPFLETKIVTSEEIVDLYYHLDGHARVGEYTVILRIQKPTSDRSLLGSFTIVF